MKITIPTNTGATITLETERHGQYVSEQLGRLLTDDEADLLERPAPPVNPPVTSDNQNKP
jgi:hypothetical protein